MQNAAWLSYLPIDPLTALRAAPEPALAYFVQDLVGKSVPAVDTLWELPEPARLVKKQQADGSWKYPGKDSGAVPGQNYALLETFRSLRVLVGMYGLTAAHPTLRKAASYVFACQTGEGDIRGIIGNQYMPYYHGAILELLIQAGYADDPRTLAGLDCLLDMRQEDGGWIVPTQAVPSRMRTAQFWSGSPVAPDRTLPHAHLATGMVLRAFAAHPDYRKRKEILAAGECLRNRLFQADRYNDRRTAAYWLKFQFPFWWTSLLTALDSLALLRFDPGDEQIAVGLEWFAANQEADGLWPTGYGSGKKAAANRRWVGLAVCRMLKRFSSSTEEAK